MKGQLQYNILGLQTKCVAKNVSKFSFSPTEATPLSNIFPEIPAASENKILFEMGGGLGWMGIGS